MVEPDFICKGTLGMKSMCEKTIKDYAVCGNGIFERNFSILKPINQGDNIYSAVIAPSSLIYEQCDNGNQIGCRGCMI